MPKKRSLHSSIESSKDSFAKDEVVNESKKRMFYAIMEDTFPNGVDVSYAQSKEIVEDISLSNKKSRKTVTRRIFAGAISATAAVLVVGVMSIYTLDNQFKLSPPLKEQDFPPALASVPEADFRSVSTNNDFFLGYAELPKTEGTVDVLVHSRSANISWETLSATDQDDGAVLPISIDHQNNIISLPATETDIYFTIDDAKGNSIECIIPKAL